MLVSRSQSNLSTMLDNAIGIIRSSHHNMPSIVHAVSSENISLIEKILADPSSPNINATVDGKKQKQYTVLHVAAKLTTPVGFNIVKLLLQSGADVAAKDKRDFTPLDWCFERMMEYPDSTSAEDLRVLRGIFVELVENKADINSKDAEGKTILERARTCKWKHQDKGFGAADHVMAFLERNGAK